MFWKSKKLSNIKEFTDLTGNSLRDVLAGNVLTKKNLLKQYKMILLLVFLAFCYIGNRYSCEQKIAEIEKLQQKLTDVKFDALTRSSGLMEISKQSQVQVLVGNKKMDLTESTTPPYLIKLEQ